MTYEIISSHARKQPHIWTTLRTDMATANLVTEIRKGRHKALPPSEFEARSYAMGMDAQGKKRYGIEVRYVPTLKKSQKTEEQKIEQLLRDSFEKMLPELVRNLVELNGKAQ